MYAHLSIYFIFLIILEFEIITKLFYYYFSCLLHAKRKCLLYLLYILGVVSHIFILGYFVKSFYIWKDYHILRVEISPYLQMTWKMPYSEIPTRNCQRSLRRNASKCLYQENHQSTFKIPAESPTRSSHKSLARGPSSIEVFFFWIAEF